MLEWVGTPVALAEVRGDAVLHREGHQKHQPRNSKGPGVLCIDNPGSSLRTVQASAGTLLQGADQPVTRDPDADSMVRIAMLDT